MPCPSLLLMLMRRSPAKSNSSSLITGQAHHWSHHRMFLLAMWRTGLPCVQFMLGWLLVLVAQCPWTGLSVTRQWINVMNNSYGLKMGRDWRLGPAVWWSQLPCYCQISKTGINHRPHILFSVSIVLRYPLNTISNLVSVYSFIYSLCAL